MTPDLSHRLSIIWFTDLVAYSTLAAEDEDLAIKSVKRFQGIVAHVLSTIEGRVVKQLGDGILLESRSAELALRAATAVHEEMGTSVRTGIHLGEVAVDKDGDLYGDAVNGAQRLQTEAVPGTIVVSEDVRRQLRNRREFIFYPLGERHLKGIGAMKLFRLVSLSHSGEVVRQQIEVSEARIAVMFDSVDRRLNDQINDALNRARICLERQIKYVFGGKTGDGLDCSGLITFCYPRGLPDGVEKQMEHLSEWQFDAKELDLLEPGDLVFFREEHEITPSHVGVVESLLLPASALIIHSSERLGGISRDRLDTKDNRFRDVYSVVTFSKIRPYLFRVLIDDEIKREARHGGT